MQRDVINHYRHAVTHYLPLTLKEQFLQNSSIGTPYQKWAKFTTDDFVILSFTVTNLIRYTTRLIHETETIALNAEKHFRKASDRSNAYIAPLVDIDHRNGYIGIRVNPDESLAVTSFSTETLCAQRVELQDRSVLEQLMAAGLSECHELEALNAKFRVLCNVYSAQHEVATAFDVLHESWWL